MHACMYVCVYGMYVCYTTMYMYTVYAYAYMYVYHI